METRRYHLYLGGRKLEGGLVVFDKCEDELVVSHQGSWLRSLFWDSGFHCIAASNRTAHCLAIKPQLVRHKARAAALQIKEVPRAWQEALPLLALPRALPTPALLQIHSPVTGH